MAAVVIGLGTTVSPGTPGNPGGSAPSATTGSPAETLGTQLASLLEEATELADGPDASTPSATAQTAPETERAHWPTEELVAARKVLAAHVDLLTPGASATSGPTPGAPPSGAVPSAATPSAATPSAAVPSAAVPSVAVPTEAAPSGSPTPGAEAGTGPAAFAERLAQSANALLTASLGAPEQLSRSLVLAGTEEALAARDVARAEGGEAAVEALPEVPLDADAAWQAFDAENGAGAGSAPPTDGAVSTDGTGTTAATGAPGAACRAEAALAGATDAAFRLAYAYQVAGARTRGDVANKAREAAADREQLGWRLQSRLPEECVPLRAAAYRLPAGFAKDPVGSAATGEEQLSALLRDAAGAAEGTFRAALAAESWSAALAAP